MAQARQRVPDNVPGEWYVDTTCIDCDLCRQVAPDVFSRSQSVGQSCVAAQPSSPAGRQRAAMALVACPTASIHCEGKPPELKAGLKAWPERIDEDVFWCGFAAESSFGATAYFIRRPGGNVLVDSPRASRHLVEALKAQGGARWLFLTHRDDVADHAFYARELGCERVIHAADARGLRAERLLQGFDPTALAPDLLAIPVPGHTPGSCALLYREKYLFAGDHLWANDDESGVEASRSVCWYSWDAQLRSMEALLQHRFEWVLPGHGRRWRARDPAHLRAELTRWLRAQGHL